MSKKLVRCVEGHVYDASEKACPICGALTEAAPKPTPKKPKAEPAAAGASGAPAGGAPSQRNLVLIGAAAAAVIIIGGAWILFGGDSGGSGAGKLAGAETAPLVEKSEKSEASSGKSAENSIGGDSLPPGLELPKDDARPVRTGGAPVQDCDHLAMAIEDPDRPQGVNGVLTVQDIQSQAVASCEKAVADYPGERRFQTALGRAYRKAGRDSDAVAAYRKAADRGSLFAAWALAHATREGTGGIRKDEEEARRLLKPLAEQGLPSAMVDYGELLFFGLGGPADKTAGQGWLEHAAGVDIVAFDRYINYLQGGTFGQQESVTIRRALERGMQLGSAEAFNRMGVLYHNADGVPRNYIEAGRLYTEAAKRGSSQALVNMGVMFERGQSVRRDYAQAWQLFDQAAGMGNTTAMLYLGDYFRDNVGVQRNLDEARAWYQKAWEKGNADGLWRLVLLFDRFGQDRNVIDLSKQALQAARSSYNAREDLFSGNGMSRDLRRAIQSQLQYEGFYSGNIDGQFGPSMRQALQAYFQAPSKTE